MNKLETEERRTRLDLEFETKPNWPETRKREKETQNQPKTQSKLCNFGVI